MCENVLIPHDGEVIVTTQLDQPLHRAVIEHLGALITRMTPTGKLVPETRDHLESLRRNLSRANPPPEDESFHLNALLHGNLSELCAGTGDAYGVVVAALAEVLLARYRERLWNGGDGWPPDA